MGEVVEHSTSLLPEGDRAAMAAYLRSVPPIVHDVEPSETGEAKEPGGDGEFDY